MGLCYLMYPGDKLPVHFEVWFSAEGVLSCVGVLCRIRPSIDILIWIMELMGRAQLEGEGECQFQTRG